MSASLIDACTSASWDWSVAAWLDNEWRHAADADAACHDDVSRGGDVVKSKGQLAGRIF